MRLSFLPPLFSPLPQPRAAWGGRLGQGWRRGGTLRSAPTKLILPGSRVDFAGARAVNSALKKKKIKKNKEQQKGEGKKRGGGGHRQGGCAGWGVSAEEQVGTP